MLPAAVAAFTASVSILPDIVLENITIASPNCCKSLVNLVIELVPVKASMNDNTPAINSAFVIVNTALLIAVAPEATSGVTCLQAIMKG